MRAGHAHECRSDRVPGQPLAALDRARDRVGCFVDVDHDPPAHSRRRSRTDADDRNLAVEINLAYERADFGRADVECGDNLVSGHEWAPGAGLESVHSI